MVLISRPLVVALLVFVSHVASFAQERVSPGYLGLMLDDRPRNIGGVPVMRVHPRTPADAAGFHVGDIVVACNGSRVREVGDFARAIYQVPAGERAAIEVQRGDELLEITAILASGPDRPLENFRPPVKPDISTNRLRDGRPMLGLVVAAMQTRSYGTFGSLRQWGVVVEDIVPNSPAEQYRVPRGAILTSINGLAIRAPDDVFAIMEQVDVDRPVELTYVFGGSAYRQVIPLADPQGLASEVAKPLEEGTVIETPPAPTPPVDVDESTLPELPLPDPLPDDHVRLPDSGALPVDVRALRSELDELRRRAATIQAELDAIKREASRPE